ncbi:MAG: amino acid ABC transporter permease [Alphaproteobacteria bacterium]|nr:amino acid ABC transporter permease [Alphaproteobacteria bacterium]
MSDATATVRTERHPDLPPPATTVGVLGWLRTNLFSSWLNTALTLLGLYLLWLIVPPLLDWAVFSATITGEDRTACEPNPGACWVFIKVQFWQFIYGFYPPDQTWRVNLTFLLFVAGVAPVLIERIPGKKWALFYLLFAFPVIAYVLFVGGVFGLPLVETALWGGLSLTLVVSIIGIVASLPLGILLALGRRSKMPILRMLSVVFIEAWRGVPLISVLFMASVMLPLFLPEGVNFDKLLRALIGVALFSAAYMAEVVRGGLQAVPRGQYEAAAALGLSYWKTMGLIVLPQALKIVIPGIVNTFIGLFKDTTLVAIIGLFDLLGRVHTATTNAAWLGMSTEGYVFAGAVFWVFCFGMSRYSIRLERKLGAGQRRR